MRPRGHGSLLAPGLAVIAHLRRGTDLDVYDAWDHARACRVVAKTTRPRASTDAARRLLAEGRLLKRLAHPHLVRAYDVHTEPLPVVTLETLPGHTLGALVDHQPLEPAEAAVLGQQLGAALAYLHAHGRLHLDVKPSNVIAHNGAAKLLDLSIARRPGRVRAGYGTWCSMAPEQARGGTVGPAADVWGLGLLLHEAVTGVAAFDVAGERTAYPQLQRRAPRAKTLRRAVPTAFDDLLTGTLEPDPRDRPTLAEVTTTLATWAPPPQVPASPARPG